MNLIDIELCVSSRCFSSHAAVLARSDELNLTQEYMAEMLGVRRTSVSLVAHTLQEAGLISYRHGRVAIVNVERLKEVACECYDTVKMQYSTLTLRQRPDFVPI